MARWALALALCLSLATVASSDCVTQCSLCAAQTPGTESGVWPLMCLWECQGSWPPGPEWETCSRALALLALAGGTDPSPREAEEPEAEPEREPGPEEPPPAPAKRYGGFLKTAGRGKLLWLLRESAQGKGGRSKKFGGFGRQPEEREAPEDSPEGAGRGLAELQKRYGGFMRRLRPRLRWEGQKRHGGVLRRQLRGTPRSDEDPGAYSGEVSHL